MWKNSWNCNARGDKYSNLTFGGVVFTISKLWKNSSNCNARGDKYSNLTFRGMTIWRDFSQLSYSKSNPPKVKLLYLSPLALQFDEFFPMINGFLKSIGVLIEVYTMYISCRTGLQVTLMSWLESKSHCSRHPSSLPLAVPLPHILWTKLSVVVMGKRCQTLRRSSQLASFILSPYFQLSVSVDIIFFVLDFPFADGFSWWFGKEARLRIASIM